jgi:hypothetical protein
MRTKNTVLPFPRLVEKSETFTPADVSKLTGIIESMVEEIAAGIVSRLAGICPQCGRLFNRRDMLSGHMTKHRREAKRLLM